jgi:DNA-binding response OmpR family regulator
MYDKPVIAIDDEFYVTKAIRFMLAQEGVECLVMTDPSGAIDLVKTRGPLVVVLDINMPKVNGLDLCRQIKKEFQETIVFFLSARAQPEDIEEGYKCGASQYIVKPFSPSDLKDKIMTVYSAYYGVKPETVKRSVIKDHNS